MVFIGLGLVILVATLANGGGPLSVGSVLGFAFARGRRRAPLGRARGWAGERARAGADADGREPLLRRGLGVPWLFAAAYSAVGFSIYFSLGVVADRGLGLTPLIFLAAGLLFVLTTLSYVEGGAMFRERGGSSTFARHAFNELIAFIAGWAILIDYLIVDRPGGDLGAALPGADLRQPRPSRAGRSASPRAVIVAACALNVLGVTGRGRQRALALLALADVGLQLAVIVVGALAVLHPDRLTAQLDLFTDPELQGHRLRARSSRCSPTPGSRPPPTSPPTSTSSRAT